MLPPLTIWPIGTPEPTSEAPRRSASARCFASLSPSRSLRVDMYLAEESTRERERPGRTIARIAPTVTRTRTPIPMANTGQEKRSWSPEAIVDGSCLGAATKPRRTMRPIATRKARASSAASHRPRLSPGSASLFGRRIRELPRPRRWGCLPPCGGGVQQLRRTSVSTNGSCRSHPSPGPSSPCGRVCPVSSRSS